MKKTIFIISALTIVLVVTLLSSIYTVNEREQVVITQFGKPVGNAIDAPGLHFKVPFIQTANYFEKRIMEWDGYKSQVPTKDKKYIWIDTFARWRIVDPLLFFQALGNEEMAQSRMDDILDGAARNVVANNNLIEVVRSNKKTHIEDMPAITKGRNALADAVREKAAKKLVKLGIELLDFKFKRINYVEEVRTEVYKRMISERKRIAEKYRSEGQGKSAEIEGRKVRELRKIRSEAYRKAKEIKGQAENEAANIYADSYAKNPEFYTFLKTLETYEESLDAETKLVISTKSRLFKLLK